jgi:hypothetical protein
MFKKILTILFAFVALLSLINISTYAIPLPDKVKQIPNPPIAGFKCGLGMDLYSVKSFDNTTQQQTGTGMRCVKYGDKVQGKISFAWYGEGYENNCSYRTLGHSWWFQKYQLYTDQQLWDKHFAAQADIWGNGECRKNNSNVASTNLFSRFDNAGQIEIYFNRGNVPTREVWTKFYSMTWAPLPRITTCGNTLGLVQWSVEDGPANPNLPRTGKGIRCVLNFLTPYTTWFGQGDWSSVVTNYTELGTKHPTLGYGSSQIFGGGFQGYGGYVLNRPYGSFDIQWLYNNATVTAPKDEYWTRL